MYPYRLIWGLSLLPTPAAGTQADTSLAHNIRCHPSPGMSISGENMGSEGVDKILLYHDSGQQYNSIRIQLAAVHPTRCGGGSVSNFPRSRLLTAARSNEARQLTSNRWGLPYHGLSGLQVGFLVAFTQLIPEHQLQLLGKLKVRVKVSCLSFLHCSQPADNRLTIPDPSWTVSSGVQRLGDSSWFVAIHSHPIRLLRGLGIPPVLQDLRGWSVPRRQERDFCFPVLVPPSYQVRLVSAVCRQT